MDIRKIRKLIQIMKETGLAEIEIKSGDESVRLSQQANVAHVSTPLVQHQPTSPAVSIDDNVDSTEIQEEISGTQVHSPIVGSVYLAKSPTDKPLVTVGQHVNAGDTLCLIEAMKMYNQIEAPIAGVVRARLVENGQAVEYDQVLFIIDPDA